MTLYPREEVRGERCASSSARCGFAHAQRKARLATATPNMAPPDPQGKGRQGKGREAAAGCKKKKKGPTQLCGRMQMQTLFRESLISFIANKSGQCGEWKRKHACMRAWGEAKTSTIRCMGSPCAARVLIWVCSVSLAAGKRREGSSVLRVHRRVIFKPCLKMRPHFKTK